MAHSNGPGAAWEWMLFPLSPTDKHIERFCGLGKWNTISGDFFREGMAVSKSAYSQYCVALNVAISGTST